MIKSIKNTFTGIVCLLSGGYGLWYGLTTGFDDDIDSLPDYDYIVEIRDLENQGRLGEAEYLADFVLEGSNVVVRPAVQCLRDSIHEKRTDCWNRACRAVKGFVVGEGVSAEELGGAVAADFFLWGDIRDLAKQGYFKATGGNADPVVASLASVGVLTSLASFWVADPAEPAEVAADASLSCLKTMRKTGHLSKRFCGVLVDACRETAKAKSASKELKEIVVGIKNLFDGAGAARASAIMKHVDDVSSLKAVSALAREAPEPVAILVRLHGGKGIRMLGGLAEAENGAVVLEKTVRKGPKAIAQLMPYATYGARTLKSLRLSRPQRFLDACGRRLGRMPVLIGSFLIAAFGLFKLKAWRIAGTLRKIRKPAKGASAARI